METFQILAIKAREKQQIANHLIEITYPLVREPKLLMSVLIHTYDALEFSMSALLEYEKNFKPIPNYNESFEQKIDIFKRKIITKYDINKDIIEFIINIKKTLNEHKKSTVEFTKKETFVISDNDYNIITLNVTEVKKTLLTAKHYIDNLLKIIKYE